jgi:hypothetical protein
MESGESGDLRKNRGQRIKEKNGCFERERERELWNQLRELEI